MKGWRIDADDEPGTLAQTMPLRFTFVYQISEIPRALV